MQNLANGRPVVTAVDECRRCGRTIVTEGGDVWFHVGAEGWFWRGCRAATFTEEDGWDDTIPREWSAMPPKHRQENK